MDLSKLCIHTITTKPWGLEQALDKYSRKGVGGISIWQNTIDPMGAHEAAKIIENHPLQVVSLVRGGFFPHADGIQRQRAIDHNKKLVEEAAIIGAPILVLVCGADVSQSLATSRDQIKRGIEALIPQCEDLEIQLAIEPLHPMYADTRSAINTLSQANEMAEYFDCVQVGVAVDVYHLWWDENLEDEILRCGRENNLLAYHICDWKSPTTDLLNDRGLMGEGCIPLRTIARWVNSAGFHGFHEVEIFSNTYWAMDQDLFLNRIIDAYIKLYKA